LLAFAVLGKSRLISNGAVGTVNRSRRSPTLPLVALLLSASATSCASLGYSGSRNLRDWYLGRSGFGETFEHERPGRKCSYSGIAVHHVTERRAPWFGHFRVPDLVIQLAGGVDYPERIICVAEETRSRFVEMQMTDTDPRAQLEPVGEPIFVEQKVYIGHGVRFPRGSSEAHVAFDMVDAGIIDCIIPYRLWNSDADGLDKLLWTLGVPVKALGNGLCTLIRAPVYAVHDIAKLVALPMAARHFAR